MYAQSTAYSRAMIEGKDMAEDVRDGGVGDGDVSLPKREGRGGFN